jgi:hypothetical protein
MIRAQFVHSLRWSEARAAGTDLHENNESPHQCML